MNLFQQRIYNLYLKAVRANNNQPFKYRQDFDGFEEKPEYAMILKIQAFFVKFPHIQPEDFFNAPYEIHPDTGHLELKFYTTQKAIAMWGLANKKRMNLAPDSSEQINFLIQSYKFVASFCCENGIRLEDYLSHQVGGVLSCAKHFKNKEISIYTLISLGDIEGIIRSMDEVQSELFFENIDVISFKIKYFQSSVMKKTSIEAITRIKKYIEENVSKR